MSSSTCLVCMCVRTCAHVCLCVCMLLCVPVCSSVSTHCQVVEAARTVKEEVESTSEDCSEELIQLEVGGHGHTHACTHAHTQTRIYTHGIHAHHILVTCTICSGCGSGLRGMSGDVRLVLVARWNVIIMCRHSTYRRVPSWHSHMVVFHAVSYSTWSKWIVSQCTSVSMCLSCDVCSCWTDHGQLFIHCTCDIVV